MQRILPSLFLLLLPVAAFAHEHRVYQVGDKSYNITVGMLNEPVHVDDKTGVEVIVSDLSKPVKGAASDDGPAGAPVTGLEKTLKVELSAGDQKKTLDLEPEDGATGAYQAVFYPTVQTTYTFRLTGTLNGQPIDVSYSCNPAATEDTPEDTTPLKVNDTVTQVSKGGAFGCPEARSDDEFPVQSDTDADLTARVTALEHRNGPTIGAAIAIAVAIGVSVASARRRKQ